MKPVRWGVLGAANFARVHMAPAINMAEGAELAALATSDPAKAEGFRAFCPQSSGSCQLRGAACRSRD
jgi:predicted dehydrogenase